VQYDPRVPLSGITILDLTRVLSGPYCTMMLGDLGARVIKIERPGRGDDTRTWGPPFLGGESTYYLSVNRNKESLSLDFGTPQGGALLERLLARADVLVENFRPGTLAKYGFDAARVTDRFPRLVYCSISGYGQTGPRRAEAGYDAIIQAEGGLMSLTGEPDGTPFRLGLPIADLVAGLYAAQGITAALLERERSGKGAVVDVSLLESVASLLTYQAVASLATGEVPQRHGNGHPSIVPYDTFATSDGPLMVAVGNDEQWHRFCEAAGVTAIADDPRFATNPDRVRHRGALIPILERTFRTRGREEWMEMLRRAHVPCGSVRDVIELLADPQLAARDMVATLRHPTAGAVRAVGSPIRLSAASRRDHAAPPRLGEHTDAILSHDLGLDGNEVRGLREQRVV
jgi:crotonobetainyl-CoA:carnitine CoA-transferase CaiB-like acyl-CoA transferase